MKRIKHLVLLITCLTASSFANKAQAQGIDSSLYSVYYWHSKDMFDKLPDIDNEIIFLGNSITDGAEWSELLNNPKCLNRGISGDVTAGVLLRLKSITDCQPDKLFLMIGVNDLALGKSKEYIIENYLRIIDIIQKDSPRTRIFVQSILPVNPDSGMFKNHTNKSEIIVSINKKLEHLSNSNAYTYIDIHSSFTDSDGYLKSSYSLDGLHLRSEAYETWARIVKDYINN